MGMPKRNEPVDAIEAFEAQQTLLKQRLAKARLRPTRARLAVLGLLGQAGQPQFDAEAIYQALSAQDRRASLGTVYRILKELEQRQLVMREFDQEGRALYMNWADDAPAHLVHVACRDSGQTFRLVDDELHEHMEKLLASRGWKLADMPLTIQLSARRDERGVGGKSASVHEFESVPPKKTAAAAKRSPVVA